jgi:hypothetical protein
VASGPQESTDKTPPDYKARGLTWAEPSLLFRRFYGHSNPILKLKWAFILPNMSPESRHSVEPRWQDQRARPDGGTRFEAHPGAALLRALLQTCPLLVGMGLRDGGCGQCRTSRGVTSRVRSCSERSVGIAAMG